MILPTIRHLVLHHSATKGSQDFSTFIKAIDQNHKDRLHPQQNGLGNHIAYHYVISNKGEVKATRPENEVGYHAGKWTTNISSLGICLQGDFTKESIPVEQLEAAKSLVFELREHYKLPPESVIAHNKVKATACPGLTDDEIEYIANGKPAWMEILEQYADQHITDMPKLLSGDPHSFIALVKRTDNSKRVDALEKENKRLENKIKRLENLIKKHHA
jgi:N-acetyl-anhydromuramyl-L-alanine amidase AmpD